MFVDIHEQVEQGVTSLHVKEQSHIQSDCLLVSKLLCFMNLTNLAPLSAFELHFLFYLLTYPPLFNHGLTGDKYSHAEYNLAAIGNLLKLQDGNS